MFVYPLLSKFVYFLFWLSSLPYSYSVPKNVINTPMYLSTLLDLDALSFSCFFVSKWRRFFHITFTLLFQCWVSLEVAFIQIEVLDYSRVDDTDNRSHLPTHTYNLKSNRFVLKTSPNVASSKRQYLLLMKNAAHCNSIS